MSSRSRKNQSLLSVRVALCRHILMKWNGGMVECWNGGMVEWRNAGMVQYTEYPKNRPVNNTIEPPVSDRSECEEVAAYEYRTSEYLLFEGKLPEYC